MSFNFCKKIKAVCPNFFTLLHEKWMSDPSESHFFVDLGEISMWHFCQKMA